MANALQTLFSDIANAIRRKTGAPAKMAPLDFPGAIDSISTGGGGSFETDVIVDEVTITTSASNNDGYDGVCGVQMPITESWRSKTSEERSRIDQVFLVTFDGVRYLIGFGTGQIASKYSALGQESANHPMSLLGNWNLITSVYGTVAVINQWMYECKKNYPFVIDIAETENKSSVYILTKTAGTHTVKLERMPSTL
jgi:hypothetical protein